MRKFLTTSDIGSVIRRGDNTPYGPSLGVLVWVGREDDINDQTCHVFEAGSPYGVFLALSTKNYNTVCTREQGHPDSPYYDVLPPLTGLIVLPNQRCIVTPRYKIQFSQRRHEHARLAYSDIR